MTWIMLCKSILLIEIFRLNITQCKQRINRGVVIRGRYGIMNVHVILGKASTRGNMKIPGNLIHLKGSGEITPLMTLAHQTLLVTVQLVSISICPGECVFGIGELGAVRGEVGNGGCVLFSRTLFNIVVIGDGPTLRLVGIPDILTRITTSVFP